MLAFLQGQMEQDKQTVKSKPCELCRGGNKKPHGIKAALPALVHCGLPFSPAGRPGCCASGKGARCGQCWGCYRPWALCSLGSPLCLDSRSARTGKESMRAAETRSQRHHGLLLDTQGSLLQGKQLSGKHEASKTQQCAGIL